MTTGTGRTPAARRTMRRITIGRKLAAMLAVPLVALAVITTIKVVATVGEAREVRDETELAQASLGPDGLVNALQAESQLAATSLVGLESMVGDLGVEGIAEARQLTDGAAEAFRRETERRGGATLNAYEAALDGLGDLADVRAATDAYDGPRDLDSGYRTANDVFQGYSTIIERFHRGNDRIAAGVDDAELRMSTELINDAARLNQSTLELTRTLAVSQLTGGRVDRDEMVEIAAATSDYDAMDRAIATRARDDYAPLAERYLASAERLQRFRALVDETAETGEVDITQLIDVGLGGESDILAFRDEVAARHADRADELNAAASARQWRYLGGAGLVLLVASVVSALVARSITRPLRSLTRQATAMAEHHLPNAVHGILHAPLGEDVSIPDIDPVQVTSRDEVGDVAEALNTVQLAALDLAVEQAVLRRNIADSFVNLGRRNQNLLSRQLDFITELEASETDPDTLADLFQLDHLATRMRRNAESLLVLGGVTPPRKWAAPLPLIDVIRAALGEVEDYQRVALRSIEPATVLGSAATDVAHVLAELVENALAFSAPGTSVEVYGRDGRGHPDGYVIAVVDYGPGMTPEDIDVANRRLAGTESFTVAPSRYLGHYVAGRLAARHGIAVVVDNPANTGLVATVTLPRSLLADSASQPPTGALATSSGTGALPPTAPR